jgi:hypothetical protein
MVKTEQKLYHATYKRYLDSIKKHGLGGKIEQKAWEDAVDDVVCFAHDIDEAYSYAESADITEEDEELLDEIVILEVDATKLDKYLLFVDSNILTDDKGMLHGTDIPAPLEYHGVVPFSSVTRVIDMSIDE